MTDAKKPNGLPSVLTYDDVRAVSPALEHFIHLQRVLNMDSDAALIAHSGFHKRVGGNPRHQM
jgi:hypothetical protein